MPSDFERAAREFRPLRMLFRVAWPSVIVWMFSSLNPNLSSAAFMFLRSVIEPSRGVEPGALLMPTSNATFLPGADVYRTAGAAAGAGAEGAEAYVRPTCARTGFAVG